MKFAIVESENYASTFAKVVNCYKDDENFMFSMLMHMNFWKGYYFKLLSLCNSCKGDDNPCMH